MIRPTLCLHGIVRNESAIIERLLDSVADLVDDYVLVDTGSTDDTVARIRGHRLKGVLMETTFVDFGTTRSFGLEMARLYSSSDYLLLLDADMILRTMDDGAEWLKSQLQEDVYDMVQRCGGLVYRNVRILRRTLDVRCVGATHEYYDLPSGCTRGIVPLDKVWIEDVADGGCKADKFERDGRLLEASVRACPTDPRSVFYLAQTLYCLGEYRRSMTWYALRMQLGGFMDEVRYSRYGLVRCCLALNDLETARAYVDSDHDPLALAEAPYHVAVRLRDLGNHRLAYYYCLVGLDRAARNPCGEGVLFWERDVYDTGLLFEQSVLHYYIVPPDQRQAGLDLCLRLLQHPGVSETMADAVYRNMAFYLPALRAPRVEEPYQQDGHWHRSTPTFLPGQTLVRLVNYTILPDGRYQLPEDDRHVRTRWLLCSESGVTTEVKVDAQWVEKYHQPDSVILGIEDIRVYPTGPKGDEGTMICLGSSAEYTRHPGSVSQVLALLEPKSATLQLVEVLHSPKDPFRHEKNWVWIEGDDQNRIIYAWFPAIQFGRIEPHGVLRLLDEPKIPVPAPHVFRHMRGSSNGMRHPLTTETWFVTHSVIEGSPRTYLHHLVVLSAALDRVVRYSVPFSFEGHKIEFCTALRFTAERDGVELGYSAWDRVSRTLRLRWEELPRWVESHRS